MCIYLEVSGDAEQGPHVYPFGVSYASPVAEIEAYTRTRPLTRQLTLYSARALRSAQVAGIQASWWVAGP
jgi:hypothetical protein